MEKVDKQCIKLYVESIIIIHLKVKNTITGFDSIEEVSQLVMLC